MSGLNEYLFYNILDVLNTRSLAWIFFFQKHANNNRQFICQGTVFTAYRMCRLEDGIGDLSLIKRYLSSVTL